MEPRPTGFNADVVTTTSPWSLNDFKKSNFLLGELMSAVKGCA